jgi:hypothetical protein
MAGSPRFAFQQCAEICPRRKRTSARRAAVCGRPTTTPKHTGLAQVSGAEALLTLWLFWGAPILGGVGLTGKWLQADDLQRLASPLSAAKKKALMIVS